MSASTGLQKLVEYIAALERAGYDVSDISDSDGMVGDDAVDATVHVEFSPAVPGDGVDEADVVIADATVTDEGRVAVTMDVSVPLESTGETGDVEPVGTPVEPTTSNAGRDGNHDEETDATVGGDASRNGERPTSTGIEGATKATSDQDASETTSDDESDEPAYRDPDRLREAYEAHDTFAAMTEALGVDVTPQTVRKHAIRHGIHEPETRSRTGDDDTTGGTGEDTRSEPDEDESGSDDRGSVATPANGTSPDNGGNASGTPPEGTDQEAQASADAPVRDDDDRDADPPDGTDLSEEALSDSVGLPEGVPMDELIEAVRRAKTLYEVQRRLDLERDETHELLRQFQILDLVQGRVHDIDGDTDPEEIESRIRTTMADGD